MRHLFAVLALALGAFVLAGCDDSTSPRDTTPPAAPRGLYSTTGDQQVTLRWLANTESDVIGYRIYSSTCATGSSCPYDRVGTSTGTTFVVTGLTNGATRYYAVSAVDRDGNESDLTPEDVYDTSRPAGSGAALGNFVSSTSGAGWDFSAAISRSSTDAQTDVYYGDNGSVRQMFTRDLNTDIQDMGYASSLDAIDFAPANGWSPTGTVELIPGHCYVVWTRDDHYAKFRVTSLTSNLVVFDWAYQTAAGNGELRARPAAGEDGGTRPVAWLR